MTPTVSSAQSTYGLPSFNFTQEGEQIGSAPSLAAFNGRLWIAFKSNNSSHTLFLDSTVDGVNLLGAHEFAGIKVGSTPTLAAYNGKLYIAFTPENGQGGIFVCSTSDVVNFSCTQLLNTSDSVPAMTVYNNRLYIGLWDVKCIYVISSSDGINFTSPSSAGSTSGTPEALSILNNNLILAFQANDSSHRLFCRKARTDPIFSPHI